jgi:hypothetical protein
MVIRSDCFLFHHAHGNQAWIFRIYNNMILKVFFRFLLGGGEGGLGEGGGGVPKHPRFTLQSVPRLCVEWQDTEKTRQGHCAPGIWKMNTREKSYWCLSSSATNLTCVLQGPKPGITTKGGLENMDPRSSLNYIQTTIPHLIAESSFEVCISQGLSFLRPLKHQCPRDKSARSRLSYAYHAPTGQGWQDPVSLLPP